MELIQLSTRRNNDVSGSEPEVSASLVAASISVSSSRLVLVAKELSRQFDAIENAIDAVDDAETRARLRQSAKLSRDTLLKAMLDLSQKIQTFHSQLGA